MAFERSVSEDATNSEGWRWLGQCNADSDDDVRAIMCNIKAAETDPGNLKAHVNLGVSFTNELENERALHHLRMYIENNPEYAPLAATATGESEHDRVVDMFIQAAAQAPQDPQPRIVSSTWPPLQQLLQTQVLAGAWGSALPDARVRQGSRVLQSSSRRGSA